MPPMQRIHKIASLQRRNPLFLCVFVVNNFSFILTNLASLNYYILVYLQRITNVIFNNGFTSLATTLKPFKGVQCTPFVISNNIKSLLIS